MERSIFSEGRVILRACSRMVEILLLRSGGGKLEWFW